MLPQINDENSAVVTTMMPSKTYKLNIDTNTSIYFSQDNNLPQFDFNNNNLVVSYNSDDIQTNFEIINGNLIASSVENDPEYEINNNYIYYTGIEEYNDRIIGYVDNIEAVKQSIYHILMVERYSCLIYSNDYGVELNQYKGQDFSYLEATVEKTLKDALTYDLRIKDLAVTNITKVKDSALVKFIVYSIYGDLQMEVNIVV